MERGTGGAILIASPVVSLGTESGENISPSKLASSRHLRSSPLRRTESASASSRLSVAISAFSSPIVRAAVAWSRTSSSAASTSLSGASSRSSTLSGSSVGLTVANASACAPRCRISSSLQPLLQAFAAPVQRLVYGLRRGREPTLKDC